MYSSQASSSLGEGRLDSGVSGFRKGSDGTHFIGFSTGGDSFERPGIDGLWGFARRDRCASSLVGAAGFGRGSLAEAVGYDCVGGLGDG